MMNRIIAVLVLGTMVGCALQSWADEKEQADKVANGAELFGDMTRKSKWCLVVYPPDQ